MIIHSEVYCFIANRIIAVIYFAAVASSAASNYLCLRDIERVISFAMLVVCAV